MDNMQKVTAITKDNYQAVANRAAEVKAHVREIFEETGGKPSLGYLQTRFNMSKKALQRHVRNTLEALGEDPASIPTTTKLARKVKAKAPVIEESDETPDTEAWQAKIHCHEYDEPEAITE